MTVEEIAIRREIRQMLSEAGINKESLKEMAKELLHEELQKAVKRALSETNIEVMISRMVNSYEMRDTIKYVVRDVFGEWISKMDIKMEIADHENNQSISKEMKGN